MHAHTCTLHCTQAKERAVMALRAHPDTGRLWAVLIQLMQIHRHHSHSSHCALHETGDSKDTSKDYGIGASTVGAESVFSVDEKADASTDAVAGVCDCDNGDHYQMELFKYAIKRVPKSGRCTCTSV